MKKIRAVLAVFLIIIYGGFYYYANKTLTAINSFSSTELKGEELGEGNIIEQKFDHEIMFLIAGIDQNQDETPRSLKQLNHTRTDTLMLMKANFDTGKIDLISLPRDSRVNVNGKLDKLNHAHAYGGIALTLKTIRNFMNIDLDYYIKVSFQSVIKIVDAVGGVTVDVPMTMDYPSIGVHIPKGRQKLTGKEALTFVRYREGYSEGDMGRVKQQQKFVKELLKQTLSTSNIPKLPNIIDSIKDDIETNIPLSTILRLTKHASKLDVNSMRTASIPGHYQYINHLSYYVLNNQQIKQFVNENFKEYILR